MGIIIGGDLVPTKSNMKYFENGEISKIIGEKLLNILETANYRIFNLEAPLVDQDKPIKKIGPNLKASRKSINGIKKIGANFFTLANNHILDHGDTGLESTMNLLTQYGIDFSGAGKNINEAKLPFVFNFNNKKIGVYCCAEHEFSIATEESMGANPFDPLESLDDIARLKKEVDLVIVLYHSGKEEYRYPSPDLQRICRKMISKGAYLVVCQHTHCIGCMENYMNGTIVYGQGNFLFDNSESEFWKTGLLINIKDNFEIEYIPIEKNKYSVEVAEKNKIKILTDFYDRSEKIKDKLFLRKEYENISNLQIFKYLDMLQGKRYRSFIFRVLNKLTNYKLKIFFLKKIYFNDYSLLLSNLIDCESHRESFLAGLKNMQGDKSELNL